MKDRYLIRLLERVGKSDFEALEIYLNGFYNGKEYNRLFGHIKVFYPRFPKRKIGAEKIWELMYPKKKFNAQKLYDLCHQLYKKVKEYIAWTGMKQDLVVQEQLYLKAAKQKELYDIYRKELYGLLKTLKKKSQTKLWQGQELIPIYHQLYFNAGIGKENEGELLTELLTNLDAFYLNYRTLIEVESKNRDTVLKEKANIIKLEDIRQYYLETKLIQSPLIETFQLFLKPEIYVVPEEYDKLNENVLELLPEIEKEDKITVINFLLIVNNHYLKKGNIDFVRKAYKTFKLAGDEGIFVINKVISKQFFINAIDTACKVDKIAIQWAEDFFNSNKKFLPKEGKKNTIRISEATISFEKGDYHEAKTLLLKYPFKNPYDKLRSRWMLIKIYFELGDFGELERECTNTKQYLDKNRVFNERTIIGTKNFIKLTFDIFNHQENKSKVRDLGEKLDGYSHIFQKNWLMQKIQEWS